MKFQQQDVFFNLEWLKWNFTTFGPPRWKNLFGYPWKNLLLPPPPGKCPSDAHDSKLV